MPGLPGLSIYEQLTAVKSMKGLKMNKIEDYTEVIKALRVLLEYVLRQEDFLNLERRNKNMYGYQHPRVEMYIEDLRVVRRWIKDELKSFQYKANNNEK